MSKEVLTEKPSVGYNNPFIENKRVAETNKAKWNRDVDTILQRGDKYIEKPKPMQRSTLNYFERIKEKELEHQRDVRVRIVNTTGSKNAFQESKPNDKPQTRRIFYNNYKNKTTVPQKAKQIRVYPDLMKSNDKMKGLLCIQERRINPYENYPNHFKPKSCMTSPSDQFVKMNDRRQLFPCEQGKYDSNRANKRYNNTYSSLFNIEESKEKGKGFKANNLKNTQSTPRIKYVHKIEIKDKIDHIDNLISYHYGPKFKEENITDKPNRGNYRQIVNKTKETLNEDYIAQVY